MIAITTSSSIRVNTLLIFSPCSCRKPCRNTGENVSGTSNETAGNPFPPETGDIFLRHSSFLPRVFQVPLLLSRRRPIWRIPSFSDCRGTSPRHPLTGGISFVFHQYYITLKRNVLPQNRKKSVRFQSKLKKTVEKDDRKSRRPPFSGVGEKDGESQFHRFRSRMVTYGGKSLRTPSESALFYTLPRPPPSGHSSP